MNIHVLIGSDYLGNFRVNDPCQFKFSLFLVYAVSESFFLVRIVLVLCEPACHFDFVILHLYIYVILCMYIITFVKSYVIQPQAAINDLLNKDTINNK